MSAPSEPFLLVIFSADDFNNEIVACKESITGCISRLANLSLALFTLEIVALMLSEFFFMPLINSLALLIVLAINHVYESNKVFKSLLD